MLCVTLGFLSSAPVGAFHLLCQRYSMGGGGSIDDIVERCFLSEHLSEQVPSVILTAVPGPIIGGLALAGFGTSLALQVPIIDY